MKKTALVIFGLALLVFIINSCSKGGDDGNTINCNGVAKSWSVNVNPIIQTYCNQSGCHASGSTNGPGPLTNYTEVFNARTRIRGQIETGLMPQNATLTTDQKNSILCWIDSGAPNN